MRRFPSHTLRSRLEDYERESSKFSRRASSTSAPPREIAASLVEPRAGVRMSSSRRWRVSRHSSPFLSPSLSERARANLPVEFLPDFQFPSPKARDFVSFGLDDILHTAASDSEDFGPALADALPPSGQEARPSAAYSELVAPKSLRWIGPMSPASLELRSSTIASSSVRIPSLKGGSCHFSAICIVRSPVPGSSLFPLALLTRQPLTSPTLWVLWSRVTPPCR